MLLLSLLLLAAPELDDGLAKKMLPIYVQEASEYSIAVETGPKGKKELEFRRVLFRSVPQMGGPSRSRLARGGARPAGSNAGRSPSAESSPRDRKSVV